MHDKPRPVSRTLLFIAVGVLILWALVMGVWFVFRSTTEPRGTGQPTINQQKNQSNQALWTAKYNTEYNRLAADRVNVLIIRSSLYDTGSVADASDLADAVTNCVADVTQYNVDILDPVGRVYLPIGFPHPANQSVFCD